MLCFNYEFSKSNGKPIKYKDWELIGIDRIPVQKKVFRDVKNYINQFGMETGSMFRFR